MASALLALLSQQTPNLRTRKGLLVLGLQNDLLPGGKLPVNLPLGYFNELGSLVSAFRDFGDIVWVRAEFQANREVNLHEASGNNVIIGPPVEVEHAEDADQDDDRESPVPAKRPRVSLDDTDHTASIDRGALAASNPTRAIDDELFLTQTATKDACCLPGSLGAQHAPQIRDLIDSEKDMLAKSTHYSAFGSDSLLFALRSRLITELYICGGPTNLTVYATSMDAARYGIPVTLVEDCLLARSIERHQAAILRLREDIEAEVLMSDEVVGVLNGSLSARNKASRKEYEEDNQEFNIEDIAVQDSSDGADIEVDTDEGDSLFDPITSRPVSAHVYNDLKDLRAYRSTPQEAANKSGSMRALDESPPPAVLSNSFHNHELANDYILAVDPEPSPSAGNREKFVESSLAAPIPASGEDTYNDASGRVDIEDCLEKPRTPTKTSVSSKHPGLQALSSLAGLDQRTVDSYERMMTEVKEARKVNDAQPLFGADKSAESAGSSILYALMTANVAETVFNKLKEEVPWERMFHQTGEVPRLVCCQGSIGADGSMPVYRHPSDHTLSAHPWTPIVDLVRRRAEEVVGHPLNHALIQLYRGGTDYISEHSDKTLDIVRGSYIVNVSFGAQRTMRLRTKRQPAATTTTAETDINNIESPSRTTYRIPMPHNSLIKMSLETNAEYLHGINADKRPGIELSEAETAFEGQRISLTFRNIGTFLSHDEAFIWGQGATEKSRSEARSVVNADVAESERLIWAFGKENQATTMKWDEIYGKGFDVLHLK